MTRREEIRELCDARAVEVAQIIGASAWYDHARGILTPEEDDEVMALWHSMPGSTCYTDAFLSWMEEEPK